MTDIVISALAATHDDLQIVREVVALRLSPGSGEADRVARVRRLLDVCADLNYAVSTYMHRVLTYVGRRPGNGDLHDDTTAVHEALTAFVREVRTIADVYRSAVDAQQPSGHLPQSSAPSG